ncbi:hypothetical protein E2C06_07980 [Dankookia rubra]|uniref:Uncharacterized protein n=1 Tax=Dankookia rubra TaxID=1442381 RepID=A0A4R5QKA4_9PROT|nr:hypothetical protein [Dankookia rubra]TDH63298.1 hypothetical protein E2C06_07980 [Dankookia rubra]
MSLKGLKLGKAAPVSAPADAKGRARAKVVAHLEQQKQLLTAHLEGRALEATRPVYRTNDAGERVRVMQPVHVRRDWFEDSAGTVHFMVRYGAKPLPLDKAGSTSVEVGSLDQLPGVIGALIAAARAGELDAQLAIAAQERSKAFKRRAGATKAA